MSEISGLLMLSTMLMVASILGHADGTVVRAPRCKTPKLWVQIGPTPVRCGMFPYVRCVTNTEV